MAQGLCNRCGAEVSDEENFCPNCGANLAEAGVTQGDQQVPQAARRAVIALTVAIALLGAGIAAVIAALGGGGS